MNEDSEKDETHEISSAYHRVIPPDDGCRPASILDIKAAVTPKLFIIWPDDH